MANHAWVSLDEWDSPIGYELMSIYEPEVRVTLACRASGSDDCVWQSGGWESLSSAADTERRCRHPSIEIVELVQLETRFTW